MLHRWRLKRRGETYLLNITDDERQLLGTLCDQLRELLTQPPEEADERMRRLFPTAYPDDPERDAEYRRYMHAELVASRLSAIGMMQSTLAAGQLGEAELMGWMRAVNSVRLVLGTMLDVSEDTDLNAIGEDDPDIGHYVLYGYLSELLDEIVRVLA